MVKLDVECMRHLSKNDLRVLVAVEMGMKNHDLVPTDLIVNIARLRHGGAHKYLSNLHRFKLLYHEQKGYDGYRLTYGGYDILALNTLLARGHVVGLGRKIGVGKESDVYIAQNSEGQEVVVKFARLGRTSFRSIKRNRDYLLHRKSASWLYMSRLAALKEYAFMKALYEEGFPTPEPIDCNRHVVCMSKVEGFPMSQLRAGSMADPLTQLGKGLDILVRLARHGLIHCDLNEFNLMVNRSGEVTVIDFPQMISTSHPNAEDYFNRDVQGLCKYFHMKMKISVPPEQVPTFQQMLLFQARDEEAAAGKEAARATLLAKEQEQEQAAAAAAAAAGKNATEEEEKEADPSVAAAAVAGAAAAAQQEGDKNVGDDKDNHADSDKDDSGDDDGDSDSDGGWDRTAGLVKLPKAERRAAKLAVVSSRRVRLDEQVKASGFFTAQQDAQLVLFLEQARRELEEHEALGIQDDDGEAGDNDDDDDDGDLREGDEDDEDAEDEQDDAEQGSTTDGVADENDNVNNNDDEVFNTDGTPAPPATSSFKKVVWGYGDDVGNKDNPYGPSKKEKEAEAAAAAAGAAGDVPASASLWGSGRTQGGVRSQPWGDRSHGVGSRGGLSSTSGQSSSNGGRSVSALWKPTIGQGDKLFERQGEGGGQHGGCGGGGSGGGGSGSGAGAGATYFGQGTSAETTADVTATALLKAALTTEARAAAKNQAEKAGGGGSSGSGFDLGGGGDGDCESDDEDGGYGGTDGSIRSGWRRGSTAGSNFSGASTSSSMGGSASGGSYKGANYRKSKAFGQGGGGKGGKGGGGGSSSGGGGSSSIGGGVKAKPESRKNQSKANHRGHKVHKPKYSA